MIAERLDAAKIFFDLQGHFADTIERLAAQSSVPKLADEFHKGIHSLDKERFSYLGDGVAVPHLRIANLAAPELFLGLSPKGLTFNRHKVHLVLLLATPAAQTAEHLQLLQRISAILPAIRQRILQQRDAAAVLRLIAQTEQASRLPSYLNLTQEQIAFELQTDLDKGLTAEEAENRVLHYGANRLQHAPATPWHIKLAKNLFSFFAILLWLAGLLCFVPGVDLPQLGVAIITVIVINGLFAFWQEYKSDRALEMLQRLIAQHCRVIRDARLQDVPASLLVPGDIIAIEEGDVVPADARLLEAYEVEVDNSSLTGESTPARRYKSDQAILIEGPFLWIELPNAIFAGTSLLRGRARAVVFGTGEHSEIGKIANLTQDIEATASPLQKQLRGTVYSIAILAGGLGALFLLLGWLLAGLTFLEAFVFFIGLFVANVPEGLLPTVTLSLAMAVQRMAKRHALVKNLSSAETLGCTTVICCDKTGTLTQNLMMATEIVVDGRTIDVSGEGYRNRGAFSENESALSPADIARWPTLHRLLECAFVCNNARIDHLPAADRLIGDPTEGALLCLAEKAGLRGIHQRLHLNPFESTRKRMSVVVRHRGTHETIAYIKGAPVEMLQQCNRIHWNEAVRSLTELDRQRILKENDALARRGLRVLALAYRPGSEFGDSQFAAEPLESRLVYLGLVALTDPVRPEVPAAIRSCHDAGIRIVMITGDYALTAESIARQIGLGQNDPLAVHTGAEIASLTDAQLKTLLAHGEAIFARVAPEHKLRVVSMLKAMGEIVAVTGDGVNDAPALKKADIGVAMGMRGNDVAKEAAHMILTDDNFSSIVAAIEEGRAIFDNIKRFAAYVFNSNPQEIYPYLVWVLVPEMPLAMTVMGVLAVDVGTDLIPAMGLGIEPPEEDIMQRPPRDRGEKLLSLQFILRSYFVQGSLLAASCYATYYYMGWVAGVWQPGRSLTAMPATPAGLKFADASQLYLQTLTAYFFPTVTTQVVNVLCKRSSHQSLFAKNFLSEAYRLRCLNNLAHWRWRISSHADSRPAPLMLGLSRFFHRHPRLFNLVANPLIDLGILFELVLCGLFFYTPLAGIYYFAPVPWQVYLFACHGGLILLAFEETKKYFRRRGYPLAMLG